SRSASPFSIIRRIEATVSSGVANEYSSSRPEQAARASSSAAVGAARQVRERAKESTRDRRSRGRRSRAPRPVRSGMRLTANGEGQGRDVRAIGELLDQLGLGRGICGVEVTKKVVPTRERGGFELSEGDRVEVVTLVGGG